MASGVSTSYSSLESYVTGKCAEYGRVRIATEHPRDRWPEITPFSENQVDGTNGSRIHYPLSDPHVEQLAQTGGRFIAICAPLPDFIPNFMRMIYREKVSLIVSLTDFTEGTHRKADPYLPYEETGVMELPGHYRVRCEMVYPEEPLTAEWSLERRDFSLQLEGEEAVHELTQFHLPGWKDFTEGSPKGIQRLVRKVHRYTQLFPAPGPIIVHCSAGVGRTGTFMNSFIIHERVTESIPVSVFEIAAQSRLQRFFLGGSQAQYEMLERVHHYILADLYGSDGIKELLDHPKGTIAKVGVLALLLKNPICPVEVVKGIYDSLPEHEKTQFRYQIYLANGSSLEFDGASREDLGEYVVENALRSAIVKVAMNAYLARIGRNNEDLSDPEKALIIASLQGEVAPSDRSGLIDLFQSIQNPDDQMRAFYTALVNKCQDSFVRDLYQALPLGKQLFYKEQIFLANRSVPLYEGEIVDDLGQYVVDHGIGSGLSIMGARRACRFEEDRELFAPPSRTHFTIHAALPNNSFESPEMLSFQRLSRLRPEIFHRLIEECDTFTEFQRLAEQVLAEVDTSEEYSSFSDESSSEEYWETSEEYSESDKENYFPSYMGNAQ